MTDDVHMLAYSVILAWLMIMTAASAQTKFNILLALGNRDDLGEQTPLSERADRAAKNMIENLVLFVAAWAAAKGAGAVGWKLTRGAQLFFIARVVYFPLYLAGVKVVRTLVWSVGVVGIGLVLAAALTA